jgi:hypothetical protein
MADIVVTAARVAMVDPIKCITFDGITAEAIEKGDPLYQVTTTGKFGIADANVANKQQVRGIALQAAGAGQAVTMLVKGVAYGWTLTDQDYDDPVYLSDTAGTLADSVGTLTVPVGIVTSLADSSATKVIFFDIRWNADYA